jgi:WD40 repeat protein
MGCLTRERWQVQPGPVAEEFAGLPGGIGVRFTSWSGSDYDWHFKNFILRAGTVETTDSLPPAPENAVTGGGESRASWLPDIPLVPYDGPYARSPDGTLLAAGVHDTGRRYSASGLVIAELATSSVTAKIDGRDEWGILGLAWSPDGRFVAVLKLQSRFRYCLGDLISTAVGHPVRLNTLSLAVFDLQGNAVAELPLIENTPRWGAEIVWTAD